MNTVEWRSLSIKWDEVIYRININDAIGGKGAFRRFKDAVHRLQVIDEWDAFREKALVRLLTRWAQDYGIAITDDPKVGAG